MEFINKTTNEKTTITQKQWDELINKGKSKTNKYKAAKKDFGGIVRRGQR